MLQETIGGLRQMEPNTTKPSMETRSIPLLMDLCRNTCNSNQSPPPLTSTPSPAMELSIGTRVTMLTLHLIWTCGSGMSLTRNGATTSLTPRHGLALAHPVLAASPPLLTTESATTSTTMNGSMLTPITIPHPLATSSSTTIPNGLGEPTLRNGISGTTSTTPGSPQQHDAFCNRCLFLISLIFIF
jgi:hypothetical protein